MGTNCKFFWVQSSRVNDGKFMSRYINAKQYMSSVSHKQIFTDIQYNLNQKCFLTSTKVNPID